MTKSGNQISKALVWTLMALLMLGLGGFGMVNLSGQANSIGEVGDTRILRDQFVQALRQEINAYARQTGQPVDVQQARLIGLDQRALARVAASSALENEATRLGLSVGDARVLEEITRIGAFAGVDGNFDRDTYKLALEGIGLSDSEFESQLRQDLSRGILERVVRDGVRVPQSYLNLYLNYIGEERSAVYSILRSDDIAAQIPQAEPEQLNTFYTAHIDKYTSPERKRITYAWLKPEALYEQLTVDETQLRQRYNERSAEFNQAERRLVERLVFLDAPSAEAAKQQLDSGSTDFETLVRDRGLKLEDIDLGDVSEAELGEAGPAIFAANDAAVIGPFPSELGPALYRINGTIEALSQSYDDVRETLLDELKADLAIRRVDRLRTELEDALAAGATLEDLDSNIPLERATFDWDATQSDDISGYESFREQAGAVTSQDYPSFFELDDGGIVALRLDEVIPPTPQAFELVAEDVARDWAAQQRRELLEAEAARLQTAVEQGAAFDDTLPDAQMIETVQRGSFLAAPSPELIPAMFALPKDGLGRLFVDDDLVVFQVKTISPIDPNNLDEALEQTKERLRLQLTAEMSRDLYEAYIGAVQNSAGLRLDQAAIDAILSQL